MEHRQVLQNFLCAHYTLSNCAYTAAIRVKNCHGSNIQTAVTGKNVPV
jgi:hypothetical protein